MVPATISTSVVVTLPILLLLTFGLLRVVHADKCRNDEEFCPIGAGVDLTNASRNTSGYIAQSGYFFPLERVKLVDDVSCGCMCDLKPCLPFCPPPKVKLTEFTDFDDEFVKSRAIPRVYTTSLIIDDDEAAPGPEERFHFVVQNPCLGGKQFFVQPKFYLLKNGSLFRPQINESTLRFLDSKKYCLRLIDNDTTYIPKACAIEMEPVKTEPDPYVKVQYFGGLLSVPFLTMTVIVYSVLPELRNTYGTTLRCHLCCTIVTYVILAARQIIGSDTSMTSRCLGFINYFSFIASFFWLNVMCFDVWWRFGEFRFHKRSSTTHDCKKFIGYSIYAWGVSITLTVMTDALKVFPAERTQVLYYYVPIGITIACNICFFILISIKIIQHNRITRRQLNNRDSSSHDDNKYWFSLLLKLFVVMGVSWSSEIISGFIEGPKFLWYITDMMNVFQGIFIFVVFVCKKSIFLSLKKRFNKENLRVFDNYQLPCSVWISRNKSSHSPHPRLPTYEETLPDVPTNVFKHLEEI